jgi:maltokinase
VSAVDKSQLAEYLARQRWYTGSVDDVVVTDIQELAWLAEPGTGLGVRVELATVAGSVGQRLYNLPLSYRTDPAGSLEHALVGTATLDGVDYLVYDALHDAEAVTLLVDAFRTGPTNRAGLEYTRADDIELAADATAVQLSGEQSNTSVVLDDTYLLKFFRRVGPGRNPDVEILAALSPEHSDIVPALHGWVTTTPTDALGPCDLAILQVFLRTATEGWESARISVRDLLAEPDQRVEEAGGDFAGEAERLGTVTREVHAAMARLLETGSWGGDELERLRERFLERFARSEAVVPELVAHRAAVTAAFDGVAGITGPVEVQRVHGDLHLGQTLRTSIGWKLIDFEGEPARPLTERVALDSPMRDVAGMLRSLDYVAKSVLLQMGETAEGAAAAADWSGRNQHAFLTGYGELTATEQVLLRAYELDKAVYEVEYEASHRPAWIGIPLGALPG